MIAYTHRGEYLLEYWYVQVLNHRIQMKAESVDWFLESIQKYQGSHSVISNKPRLLMKKNICRPKKAEMRKDT